MQGDDLKSGMSSAGNSDESQYKKSGLVLAVHDLADCGAVGTGLSFRRVIGNADLIGIMDQLHIRLHSGQFHFLAIPQVLCRGAQHILKLLSLVWHADRLKRTGCHLLRAQDSGSWTRRRFDAGHRSG